MIRTSVLATLCSLCLHSIATAQDFDGAMTNASDQFHGVAKPAQMADLPSLVPGTIAEVHVKEGQKIKKGMPLVTMDDRVPKARLAAAAIEAQLTGALKRAEVDVKMAKSMLHRKRMAVMHGAGANFELEEAEGIRDQAVAAVEQQRDILKAAEANRQLAAAQLSQYTIVAPFDGVVTEIHRKSGAVDPSQLVVSVANLDTLEVELHLPSRMVGRVRTGQTVVLQAGVPISSEISAAVMSVSPIINSASNTFRCLLKIDNKKTPRPAGFSVVAKDGNDNSRVTQTRN